MMEHNLEYFLNNFKGLTGYFYLGNGRIFFSPSNIVFMFNSTFRSFLGEPCSFIEDLIAEEFIGDSELRINDFERVELFGNGCVRLGCITKDDVVTHIFYDLVIGDRKCMLLKSNVIDGSISQLWQSMYRVFSKSFKQYLVLSFKDNSSVTVSYSEPYWVVKSSTVSSKKAKSLAKDFEQFVHGRKLLSTSFIRELKFDMEKESVK